MAEENTQPYFRSKPGDLWTAEIWNDTQVKIKEDIKTKVKELKDEIDKEGVRIAGNAEHFGRKTPEEWEQSFDVRYGQVFAEINHDHDTKQVIYFKTFSKKKNYGFINHDFNGIPLIEIYYLGEITQRGSSGSKIISNDGKNPKFLLYKKEESDNFNQTFGYKTNANGMGFPFLNILEKFRVPFKELETINDIRTRLWQKLFSGVNDNISHASSQLIEKDCIDNVTIKMLRSAGQIGDILLWFSPIKEDLYPIKYQIINNISVLITFELKDLPDDGQIDVMIIVRP